MKMAPTGATTDSNMPTTDGSMNQIPNTDSGTSDPDSALPMATTKGEFLNQYNINFEYALVLICILLEKSLFSLILLSIVPLVTLEGEKLVLDLSHS